MVKTNKFGLFFIFVLGFILLSMATIGILFWQEISLAEQTLFIDFIKQHAAFIFFVVIFILAGYGFFLDWIFRLYILPVNKVAEGITIIHSTNPSHRLDIKGGFEIKTLVDAVNRGADQYETQQQKVKTMIETAITEAEAEIKTLAAVIAELPEGIIICNAQGQILLYNNRAHHFFMGDPALHDNNTPAPNRTEPAIKQKADDQHDNGKFMGLGRSVFSIIDKNLVVHALEEISEKLERKDSDVASYFVIALNSNKLVRFETIPILDNTQQFTGFAMILREITQQMAFNREIGSLLQSLTTGIRASLASIQAAIETILSYPQMTPKQLKRFRKIIHNEVISIGNTLDKTSEEHSCHIHTQWPLVDMMAHHLARTISKKALDKLGVTIIIGELDKSSWIRVDSYSMIVAMLFMIKRLQKETGSSRFEFTIEKQERVVYLDLDWEGTPISLATLHSWEAETLVFENDCLPMTLKEVKDHHELELWSFAVKNSSSKACLRLLLPAVQAASGPETIRHLTILPDSRPEFYEFNLFEQPGQKTELDNRLLTELSFTVFDTETTGLDPYGGDEIISIGGVRIIKNRLLRQENFNRLIDPRRSLPADATKIHGIQPEMLKGKPFIETVLPLFHRFCEDTILVAHNAAFDMRMLQLKEAATGTRFINPVLDTLLLSAILHPAHKSHDIENLAVRLGINIFGRHTALGDAMMTAELFLKMIPLLKQKNIHTLKEAREASKKSYYARLKY